MPLRGRQCRCTAPGALSATSTLAQPPLQLLIDGKFVDCKSGKTYENLDPRTGGWLHVAEWVVGAIGLQRVFQGEGRGGGQRGAPLPSTLLQARIW